MISLAFFRTAAAARVGKVGGRTRINVEAYFHPGILRWRAGIASTALLLQSRAHAANEP